MLLGNQHRNGKTFAEIEVGDSIQITEKIEDQQLLLYLGLTNDSNPIFIQHDYASQTEFKRPIVPTIMVNGLITSTISKYLPGPGSRILELTLQFPGVLFHYETIHIVLEVIDKRESIQGVTIHVEGRNLSTDELIVTGTVIAIPPK
jgi:3-hydroxybutyryl-CoA dehydratase